jgi:hypothetical protein
VTSGKSQALFRASRAHRRGVSRSSRTLGAGCDGRFRCERRTHRRRTAKSCGSGVPTLTLSWRRCFGIAPITETESPVSGKSAKETVKTVARGKPDDPDEPAVDLLVCFFQSHARLRVQLAPGFPCALSAQTPRVCRDLEGQRQLQSSGEIRRENEGSYPDEPDAITGSSRSTIRTRRRSCHFRPLGLERRHVCGPRTPGGLLRTLSGPLIAAFNFLKSRT